MTERSEQQHDEGGYYLDGAPDDAAEPSEGAPPEAPEPIAPHPERDFRRTTPARLKNIRPERPRGHWGLVCGTGLYVMVSAGTAAYLPVSARLFGHVVFWLALVAAMLATVYRERTHEWEPAPRWPWVAALVCGTLAVEVLVAAVSPLWIIVGSLVALSVVVLILLMLG